MRLKGFIRTIALASLLTAGVALAHDADFVLTPNSTNPADGQHIAVMVRTDGSQAPTYRVQVRYASHGKPIIRETIYIERPGDRWEEWTRVKVAVPAGQLIVLEIKATEVHNGREISRNYGGY
jgi:hypothetical protein